VREGTLLTTLAEEETGGGERGGGYRSWGGGGCGIGEDWDRVWLGHTFCLTFVLSLFARLRIQPLYEAWPNCWKVSEASGPTRASDVPNVDAL
jgi:hypothetical protein